MEFFDGRTDDDGVDDNDNDNEDDDDDDDDDNDEKTKVTTPRRLLACN
jgi:hypothetical protein